MLLNFKISVFLLFFFVSYGGHANNCLSTIEAKQKFVSVSSALKISVDSIMSASLSSLQSSKVQNGVEDNWLIENLPESIRDHYHDFTEMFKASKNGLYIARAEKLMRQISIYALDQKMKKCYNVQVLESAIPNAFNTGCNVFITTRTLDLLNDNEVKAVLAHEISHGDQGHYTKNFYYIFESFLTHGLAIYYDLYLSLFTDEDLYSDTFKDNGHLQGIIDLYSKNGQEVELAADEGAIYILRNAKIDQSNLELALIKMTSDLEGEIDLSSNSGAVREYPSLGQRIKIIRKTCQK